MEGATVVGLPPEREGVVEVVDVLEGGIVV